jgi:hypothetical protein
MSAHKLPKDDHEYAPRHAQGDDVSDLPDDGVASSAQPRHGAQSGRKTRPSGLGPGMTVLSVGAREPDGAVLGQPATP